MIQLPDFAIAAPPCMGASWVVSMAQELGMTVRGNVRQPFENAQGLRVSMVRHPCTWLLDFYEIYRPPFDPKVQYLNTGAKEVDCLGMLFTATDINQFIQGYLDRFPGQLEVITAAFQADSVMRVEDMPWAAVELFVSLGYKVERPSRLTPQRSVPSIPRKLWRQVLDAEASYCERYEYAI